MSNIKTMIGVHGMLYAQRFHLQSRVALGHVEHNLTMNSRMAKIISIFIYIAPITATLECRSRLTLIKPLSQERRTHPGGRARHSMASVAMVEI